MASADTSVAAATVEWPTLGLILLTYAMWGAALFWLSGLWLPAAILVMAWAAAQHSSLTHEVLHGHPFRSEAVNAWLVALPLTLFIPYLRFKDMHLAHHHDENLTDPYDDPESNYLDPAVWARLSAPVQALLRANNTLLGRLVVGPPLGLVLFLLSEWRQARAGHRRVLLAWALHLPGVIAVLVLVGTAGMPVWAYLVSVYLAFALLKIRTFLEHRAHDKARARTVIIEDRGPLALLFLNNNYHVVHHMHPKVPWYGLPALYAQRRAHYLGRNEGYRYRSYAEVFRQYLFRAKDPVPHPTWTPGTGVGQRRAPPG